MIEHLHLHRGQPLGQCSRCLTHEFIAESRVVLTERQDLLTANLNRPVFACTVFSVPRTVLRSCCRFDDHRDQSPFLTGKSPAPIERTLLTSGLGEAGVRSVATGQKRIATPHLNIRYTPPRESLFARK